MESGSKPWTDRHGVTWQWIDARGYPFVRRSGPLYHCTACNKSGSGHQHPRHCKSQEHADKVREVERTAALRAAAGGAAEADRTVAVADARAAAARTRVHTTAPAAAAAAAAAVDIRSLTPSPAPKVVTPHTELVLNGMQPFVCVVRRLIPYCCCAERLCTYVGRRSGRQCSCRIARDEPHFSKGKKTGFVSCNSCWHALGLHPGPTDRVGSPPARSAAPSAAPSCSPSAAVAAAALVTIRGTAADANAAEVDDVEVLEPIGVETRKRHAQLSARNTTHGARRAATGNPTRAQLTIIHYELSQPLLAAFVDHLKVKGDRQAVQVWKRLRQGAAAACGGCVC